MLGRLPLNVVAEPLAPTVPAVRVSSTLHLFYPFHLRSNRYLITTYTVYYCYIYYYYMIMDHWHYCVLLLYDVRYLV